MLLAVAFASFAYRPASSAPAVLVDKVSFADPAEVFLNGFLGDRIRKSATVRLLAVNEDELLAGFRHKPGSHPWIGEHVGKFLHAASLAYRQTGDPRLRAKVVRVARGLIAAQEPDGYLGTYLPADRWQVKPGADWDVWSHKYCLIGLLAYYGVFHDPQALAASRKAADLLCRTFGPGRRSILSAGTHMGMASTSVLEPMVSLYRATKEPRYLEFAEYLVGSWTEPGGPDILRGLLAGKGVDRIANGKAYEMLSNLVGLCELGRVTGNRSYVTAARNAWQDIRSRQRYITGTASSFEHFHAADELPDTGDDNVGETCVTVTWMQLNAELLRLTGDAAYGAEIERSAMNHLSGAQRPDGAAWCYYTPLEGEKPYGTETNCCLSSGPCGMAMLPTFAYLRFGSRGIGVNLLESGGFKTRIGGLPVALTQFYGWSHPERLTLRVDSPKPVRLALKVRVPEWTALATAPGASLKAGWLDFGERTWSPGECCDVRLSVRPRVVPGGKASPHRSALMWGPFVYAVDEKTSAGEADEALLSATTAVHPVGGSEAMPPIMRSELPTVQGARSTADLIPFAQAGATGGYVRVWLPDGTDWAANSPRQTRSRRGNVRGSIVDGDPSTFAVTYDGSSANEDWFCVAWRNPVEVRRITFRHGKTFHDGGWFDATGGKPRIEVRRVAGGPWETIGDLVSYPETTSGSASGLAGGEAFELELAQPLRVMAVRVVGKPSSGDHPGQAFSSCAELTAR